MHTDRNPKVLPVHGTRTSPPPGTRPGVHEAGERRLHLFMYLKKTSPPPLLKCYSLFRQKSGGLEKKDTNLRRSGLEIKQVANSEELPEVITWGFPALQFVSSILLQLHQYLCFTEKQTPPPHFHCVFCFDATFSSWPVGRKSYFYWCNQHEGAKILR